jgi:hypothetical protein
MAFLKAAIVAALVGTCAFAARAEELTAAGEYQIKAAFLVNFARFIEWPPEGTPADGTPFVIGLVGDDPFHSVLLETSYGESINGRPIAIRRLRWNERLDGCQILFIGSSEVQHLQEIIAALGASSVLTVGDFDSFARRGGMIELRTLANHVRFDVNKRIAASARLRISSKLLSLARVVIGQ